MSAENQKTILLVEDEMVIAMVEKFTIEKFGYNVIMANSGEEAVDTVEKTPSIDLILMDIELGAGMDGTEAAEIILRERDIPIVFLSSHTEPEIVAKTEKITSYGYLVKNSGNTVLQALIKIVFKLFEAKKKEKEKEPQREAALEALQESEEKYRTLVEKANEAIIIVQNSVFVFANRRMSDFLGVPAGDLEGKPFINFVWPEDRELVIANYRKRIAGETVRDAYDFRIIGAGGRLTWVFLSAAAIQWKGKPATLNLLTDITERKRAEELFQTIFENMGTALIIIEEDTIISHMNAGMEKICGYKKEEIEGLVKWPKLVVEEDLIKMLEYHSLRRIDPDSAPGSYEFRLIHKTGELRDAALTAAMVPGTKKSVISIRDITERKQAEAEIKRQLAEKEILLKEVHHRIKNNIASIGALISLHVQSTVNPEAIAVLQDAIGRVNSMRILYDKLLLSEDYKDISVKNYLDDLIDTIIAIFPNHAKIIFEKHIADFHLDSKRLFPLGIIINELLTNIMKYAFSNGDTGLIKISLTNVDNHVALTIQDNGKGLPTGFDINASEGFGLKLVKMLSQQLGGNFTIENQAGNRCMIEFNI